MKAAYGSNWRLGVLLTCVAFLCFTLFDGCVKWVGERCPVFESFLIMTTVAAATIAIATIAHGGAKDLKTRHFLFHIMRGILNVGSMVLFIYALWLVPLANFYSLVFSTPLMTVILAALIYRDRPGWPVWLAIIAGFGGVLIVLRPTVAINVGELCVLGGALSFSLDIMFMRHAGGEDTSAAIAFYMMLSSIVCSLPFLFNHLQPLPVNVIGWLIAAGVCMGIGNICLAEGFRLASTPVAAPFHYTQLLWGVPLGYFVWHELPDAYTWLGGAVIVASGLYLLRHEARRTTATTVPE